MLYIYTFFIIYTFTGSNYKNAFDKEHPLEREPVDLFYEYGHIKTFFLYKGAAKVQENLVTAIGKVGMDLKESDVFILTILLSYM